MADSLGSLIDKLSIVQIKLFNTQQHIIDWNKLTREEFEAIGYEKLRKVCLDLNSLNMERSGLIREIDQTLDAAVRSGKVKVDERVKLV